MLGKIPNIVWLEGAFVETIKGWQSGWFYITEPRDPEWAAAPEFRSGTPMRLTSWKEKGLPWGNSEELTGLQALYPKAGGQEARACQRSPGHAHPPDSPVPTTGL